MSSYIATHRAELARGHYVRVTKGQNYWFDFTSHKMKRYQEKFGNDFCAVLSASDTQDDTYIIPFKELRTVFVEELIDNRGRWTGTIHDDFLRVYRSPSAPRYLPVSAYYNAFDLL